MGSNNFRVYVVVRVTLLVLLAAMLMYSLIIAHWIVTSIIIAVLMAGVTYQLIRFAEKANREFATFLMSIKSSDFSKHSLNDKRGASFVDLRKAMNTIIEEFQIVRIEKEAHFMYLQSAIEHMTAAIISFDEDGNVGLMNQQAKELLDCHRLKSIHALKQINDTLYKFLMSNNVFSKQLLDIHANGEHLKLSVRCTDFNIQGVEHRLVSIQNIRPEIEDTEMEAWERLLRVLTHEIMNSITPLSSLSATLKSKSDTLLSERHFDEEAVADLSAGLSVIAKRSNGLINFIDHYRTFTSLPAPELKTLNVKDLVERVVRLKQAELREKNIVLNQEISDNFPISCDPGQIEQVLINLINNAIDALKYTQDAVLKIVVNTANGKTQIHIIDNGNGVEPDNLEKIFIPFFSTKNTGMGIGLSLSKQIMRLHGGSIKVTSIAWKHTVFSLEFPDMQ